MISTKNFSYNPFAMNKRGALKALFHFKFEIWNQRGEKAQISKRIIAIHVQLPRFCHLKVFQSSVPSSLKTYIYDRSRDISSSFYATISPTMPLKAFSQIRAVLLPHATSSCAFWGGTQIDGDKSTTSSIRIICVVEQFCNLIWREVDTVKRTREE